MTKQQVAQLLSEGRSETEIYELARSQRKTAPEVETTLDKIWRVARTPLLPEVDLTSQGDASHPLAKVGQVGYDFARAISTPLDALSIAAGVGAGAAAKAGLMGISKTARGIDAAAQLPYLAEGVNHLVSGESTGEKLAGAAEAGLAGFGIRSATRGAFNPKAVHSAYMKERGLPVQDLKVPHDPALAQRIGNAYDQLPAMDPKALPSYESMGDEVSKQFEFLAERAGVKMEPWTQPGQPYANSAEMMADVKKNNRLYYFPTDAGYGSGVGDNAATHPLLKPGTSGRPINDEFRAAHDYFGHTVDGNQFGPKGEEAAFQRHFEMFPPDARPALATETRGQNSWVNYGPHLQRADGSFPKKGDPDFIPQADRPFADQKVALLPEELRTPGSDTLSLEHRSATGGLDTLDPASQGTGLKGAELKRRANYSEYPDRSYATVAGGQVEKQVGDLPYTYDLQVPKTKVLDVTSPEGEALVERAKALASDQGYPPSGDALTTLIEKLARDEGYTGLRYSRARSPYNDSVALFEPTPMTRRPGEQTAGFDTQDVARRHASDGGSSTTIAEGDLANKPGFSVSANKASEVILDRPPTRDDIKHYVLAHKEALSQPGKGLGTWEDNGKHYLDVFDDEAQGAAALEKGRLHGQLAIWDRNAKEAINTGITQADLDATAKLGADLPSIDQLNERPQVDFARAKTQGESPIARSGDSGPLPLESMNEAAAMSNDELQALKDRLAAARPEKPPRASHAISFEDAMKGDDSSISLLDDAPTANASGESMASVEAINRQKAMLAKGQTYAVRKGGTTRKLVGPEAVDYVPQPGEEFGILDKSGFQTLARGEARKTGTKLAAIGAPAAALGIEDDPDSQWDDTARMVLMGAGLAGAAAHFPKGLGAELKKLTVSMNQAAKAGQIAAGIDPKKAVGATDSQLKTAIRTFLKERFPGKKDKVDYLEGTWHTVDLPTDYRGVNFDARRLAKDIVKKDKTTKRPVFDDTTNERLDVAFARGKEEPEVAWGDPAWIGALVDNNPEMAVKLTRLLGATSPGTKTHDNVAQAAEIFIRHTLRKEPLDHVLSTLRGPGLINQSSKLDNIARANKGGRIYQQKTESLAGNELGVKNRIPIDLWLMRAFGAHTDKTPKALYPVFEEAFKKYAADRGEDPFTVMATIWTGMQHIKGTPTLSFANAAKSLDLTESLLDPKVQDHVLNNLKYLIARNTGAGVPQGITIPPVPKAAVRPKPTHEDFAEKARALFLRTQHEGDVLGKQEMSLTERWDLWNQLKERGLTEGLVPPSRPAPKRKAS